MNLGHEDGGAHCLDRWFGQVATLTSGDWLRHWRKSLASAGCRQSVFRAELLAVVRALEECHPRRVVSDCKGVVKALQAIQSFQRHPKAWRHKDLEVGARNALTQACQLHWVKAHQTRHAVDERWITLKDFQGNQEADEVANLGAVAHAAHEPTAEYLRWRLWLRRFVSFWLLVGPKLRDRPEAWPCARLPALAKDAEAPHALPGASPSGPPCGRTTQTCCH
eukprot:3207396-Amphidinium_carterae.1